MSTSTPSEQEFALRVERGDGEHRLVLEGELDLSSADRLAHELERLDAPADALVVIDLERLQFIDSTGLRVFIQGQEALDGHPGGWEIVPGPEPVQRVFELTGTAEHLPFRSA